MLRYILLSFILITSGSFKAQTVLDLGLNKAYHGVSEGYTLFAPLLNTDVYLINNCGELVHTWDSGNRLTGNSVELLENGRLLKASRDNPGPSTVITGGGGGQYAELIDWDGSTFWEYEYSDGATVRMHHDIEKLPNGNVLILAWDLHEFNDCVASGRRPTQLLDTVIWSEHIIEVDPTTNQIVWDWWLWDHLVQDYDSTQNNFGIVGDHPELVDINYHGIVGQDGLDDWIHANSIAYNAELDQIVMNSRHLCEFYIIDHSTTSQESAGHTGGNSGMGGDILYRWGNPIAYDQGTGVDVKIFGAHDVQWMPDSLEGPNKMLLFNNGWQRLGQEDWSNVMKLELPWNSTTNKYDYTPGTSYAPQEHYWDYSDTVNVTAHGVEFYSGYISGAQAIYNGNTLICDGAYGRLFEIDSTKEIVWEYYSPIIQGSILNQGDTLFPFALGTGNPIFRANKYRSDYAGFNGQVLFAGDPIEGGFQVPYNCAGFASLNEKELGTFEVFPNPANSIITIRSIEGNVSSAVICNSLGQVLMNIPLKGKETEVDLSAFESGSYYVIISDMKTMKVNIIR